MVNSSASFTWVVLITIQYHTIQPNNRIVSSTKQPVDRTGTLASS